MSTFRASAVGLAATAIFFAAAVAACGGEKSSSRESETSSASSSSASASVSATSGTAAAAGDYSNLLIKPADIGPEATADGPPNANPAGVTGVGQVFRNPDGKRTIVDTIAVLPDTGAAAAMIPAMKEEVAKKVKGEQRPIDIGTDGFMVAGTSADPTNPMEISEVVFLVGRAVVDLEFDSSAGNPTPDDVLLDLARKQEAAVKSGLPA